MSRFLPTAPYRGTRDFLPSEMSVRQVTVRNMATGEQQLVAAASVTEAVALTIGKQAP